MSTSSLKEKTSDFKIALYADGAESEKILKRYREGVVQGFTTNPSLMAKAGVRDYAGFARSLLSELRTLPISFEVFADEPHLMEREAMEIASWGENVNVKIPITNTKGQSTLPLVRLLLDRALKLNITALFTQVQLDALRAVLRPEDSVIISIFAGRIADTGVDPMPLMRRAVRDFAPLLGAKILWASSREVFNIYQAQSCACHIITATDEQIQKLEYRNKDLTLFSLETVQSFYEDARRSGFCLFTD